LDVRLRIENPTSQAVQFRPQQLALLHNGESIPAGADGTPAYVIAAGESRNVNLHFVHFAWCDGTFEIALNDSLVVGASPIQLASLKFQPY
jgi:hypothetical protein